MSTKCVRVVPRSYGFAVRGAIEDWKVIKPQLDGYRIVDYWEWGAWIESTGRHYLVEDVVAWGSAI